VPAFEPVTKWNATVDDVNRFPDMVRQGVPCRHHRHTGGRCICKFRGNEGQVDGDEGEMEPMVEAGVFARAAVSGRRPDQASVLAAG